MRVLITGGTGFVGRTLCASLARSPHRVRLALRRPGSVPGCSFESTVVGEVDSRTQWSAALAGIETVVHAAALAHLPADAADEERFMEVNARGTAQLARAAAAAGVRRFILLSSIKVNGEGIEGRAYTRTDPPDPRDGYARSKYAAEQFLEEVAQATALERVIVRAPLIYGPGVKANFLRLLHWVERQWPLPLARIDNARSMLSVWNLCDLIVRLIDHPGAAGTWLVADGEDLSTPELIRRIARVMHRRARLLPVPARLLAVSAALAHRTEELRRLCGSLTVDASATCRELAWAPPLAVDEGLARTVAWYLSLGGSGVG